MPAPFVIGVIGIAIIGWFATLIAIKNSRLSRAQKQLLMVPSWLPWIGGALGAPIASGALPLNNAISIGGALTMGLLISILMTWLRR